MRNSCSDRLLILVVTFVEYFWGLCYFVVFGLFVYLFVVFLQHLTRLCLVRFSCGFAGHIGALSSILPFIVPNVYPHQIYLPISMLPLPHRAPRQRQIYYWNATCVGLAESSKISYMYIYTYVYRYVLVYVYAYVSQYVSDMYMYMYMYMYMCINK